MSKNPFKPDVTIVRYIAKTNRDGNVAIIHAGRRLLEGKPGNKFVRDTEQLLLNRGHTQAKVNGAWHRIGSASCLAAITEKSRQATFHIFAK